MSIVASHHTIIAGMAHLKRIEIIDGWMGWGHHRLEKKQAYSARSWGPGFVSLGCPEFPRFPVLVRKPCEPSLPCPFGPCAAGSGPFGFRMIVAADTAPSTVPEPEPELEPEPAASSSVVRAKMRSRAALYRAERSAKDPAEAAGELVPPSLALAPFWVGPVERLRMRMGDWKAEAGGTTLGMDPVRGDVTTSWGMGASLFLHIHRPTRGFQRVSGRKGDAVRTRCPIFSGCLPRLRKVRRPSHRGRRLKAQHLCDVRRLPFPRPVSRMSLRVTFSSPLTSSSGRSHGSVSVECVFDMEV